MDRDLGLRIGARYTIALVMFFPPYFLFEVNNGCHPDDWILKITRFLASIEHPTSPSWKRELAFIHCIFMGYRYDWPGECNCSAH